MTPPGVPPTATTVANEAVVAAVSLALVVVGGELFTTGTEWVGERLDLGRSATGAVFAALATTVPETLIPVLAILQGAGDSVGVGAILGGPITLTTLAVAVLGAAAWAGARLDSRDAAITVDARQVGRDLRVFLVGFSLAALTALFARGAVRLVVAAVLVAIYLRYLAGVLSGDGADNDADPEALAFGKVRSRVGSAAPGADAERDHARDPSNRLVAAQVVVALAALLLGSHLLVGVIERVSGTVLPVPSVLVALLVAPFVSNLPENVDGVVWVRRGKDDLAVEQVTGTLAFQGTVVVAIGVTFTRWRLVPAWGSVEFLVGLSVLLALLGGAVLYVRVALGGDERVHARLLVGLGLFYLAFLAAVAYYVLAGLL